MPFQSAFPAAAFILFFHPGRWPPQPRRENNRHRRGLLRPPDFEKAEKARASCLYRSRGTLSTQGKKAWDLILAQLLDFDASKWEKITRWNESVYKVEVDLQANGIFVQKSELTALASMFMDDEPRTFVLKDWGCDITEKEGLAWKITMWAPLSAEGQDELLEKIEANTAEMLSAANDDMSRVQRLKVVSDKYKAWLKYGNGGQLLTDSLGGGVAVCGGNARGYIYLSERLGIKSIWGRSGPHAWSFTKIRDIDYWFKTDLLSGEFLAPGINGKGNLTVGGDYTTRHYKWFDFGTEEYPRRLLRYPSVWVSLSASGAVIAQSSEYNVLDFVTDFGSIYTDGLNKNDITVTVDKVDKNGSLIKENIKSFALSSPACDMEPGYYRISYSLADNGKSNFARLLVRVSDGEKVSAGFDERVSSSGSSEVQAPLGLWDGADENWYKSGIYLNEGASVTFDISGKDYKYVSFDYRIKDSVRKNLQWGSNGIVAARVSVTLADGTQQVIHEGKSLGWKAAYESIFAAIPENAVSLTITNVKIGGGNNHGGIGGLRFITDGGSTVTLAQENPPRLTVTEASIYSDGEFDPYSLFAAYDGEDGEMALSRDNFSCGKLPKNASGYIPGTYKLAYSLTDADGNTASGTVAVTVKRSASDPAAPQAGSSSSSSRPQSSSGPQPDDTAGHREQSAGSRPDSEQEQSSSGQYTEKPPVAQLPVQDLGSRPSGGAIFTRDRNYAAIAAVVFLTVLSVPAGAAGIFLMLKKYK